MSSSHNDRRETCLACGKLLLKEPLLTLPDMPESAQNIPKKEALLEEHGISLRLRKCPHCGLVQLDCSPVSYYRDVIRAVGLSQTMRELRRRDYTHLIEAYGLSEKKWIECGCGTGAFLEVLREFPVKIYGTEADRTNADIAHFSLNRCEGCGSFQPWLAEQEANQTRRNIGMCTILNTFPETAEQRLQGAPFDCFLSFNFLEHQPDPAAMLGCMYTNLAEEGIGLITVPSYEYILEEGRYYELIRDHIAYYTMESLKALCESCGFSVLEAERIGIGDTLRAVVKKTGKRPGTGKVAEERARAGSAEKEAESAKKEAEPLRIHYETFRQEIAAFTERLLRDGRRLAMWGAGHQGFTAASTTALKGTVRYIIDNAGFKQGRYAPASHIPIVSPAHFSEEPVDVILIAAPGYRREIEQEICRRYREYPTLKVCDLNDLTERSCMNLND